MFWNDLRSAFRNLKKRKFATFINGIGLAIAIAFFILLASFIRDETTYDRFHPRADQIYLVTNEFHGRFYGGSAHFLAQMLESEYPEVRDAVRLSLVSCPVRNAGEIAYRRIGFADPELLKMFHFPVVLGDSGRALDDPGRILLSREAAQFYFGRDDPLGKTLSVRLGDGFKDFLVSGVPAPIPGNSSIRFDFSIWRMRTGRPRSGPSFPPSNGKSSLIFSKKQVSSCQNTAWA
jgi:putative ABC transport system permease protein